MISKITSSKLFSILVDQWSKSLKKVSCDYFMECKRSPTRSILVEKNSLQVQNVIIKYKDIWNQVNRTCKQSK